MDNKIKKLVALASSASILFSIAPMAFAEGDIPEADLGVAEVYYDEDFSSFDEGVLVNLDASTSPNTTYEESNGMTFSMIGRTGSTNDNNVSITDGKLQFYISKYTNGGRNPRVLLSRTTGITIQNNLVVNFDVTFNGANQRVTFLDSVGTEYVYTLPDSSYAGQEINLTYVIRDGVDMVVARANGEIIDIKFEEAVPATDDQAAIGLVDLAAIYIDDKSLTDTYIDNLRIADEDFALDNDEVFSFVGNELDIAAGNENVTENGDAYDIIGGFDLPKTSIADATITWSVKQKAIGSDTLEPTEFLSVVDNSSVTMDASKDFTGYIGVLVADVSYNGATATFEYDINLPSVDVLLENIANSFDITANNTGIVLNGDKYTVTKNFTVPSSDIADVTWQSYIAPAGTQDFVPSDIVTVNASNTSKITIPEGFDASASDVKLVATISLRDSSKQLEYMLDIQCGTTGDETIYYDQNFSQLATGTLVACDSNITNDTYADLGMTFSCGSRSNGGGNEFNATVEEPQSGSGKLISFIMSNYVSDDRPAPTMQLERSGLSNFKSGVYVSADLTFTAANSIFQIADNTGTSVALSLNDSDTNLVGKQLTWKVKSSGSSTMAVAYDNGVPVKVIRDATGIKNVASVGLRTNTATQKISLANLYIADSTYTIPDADIFAADAKNFDLTASGITKTTVDGKAIYSIDEIKDITLPTLAFSTVTWKAYQKDKNAEEWTDTSFLTISGNTLVVNPTDTIDNYDVKLVATVSYGSASEEREFTMALPNPSTELDAALQSGYQTVHSNDNASTSINLATNPVLKSDIVLPKTVTGSSNVTVSWTSSDDTHLKINSDNVAEINTADLEAHTVTLTATLTYTKGSVSYSKTQEFPVTVSFTAEDKASTDTALDKYKVRFDSAYAPNFESIPTSASSNISLPSEGYFGSKITWLSSAPTIISNSGAYKRPSATRTVVMTATIMSGASSATKNFEIKVSGSSGGGGGAGGGGSTSSTGTTSSGSGGGTIGSATNPSTIPDRVTGQEIVDDLINDRYEAENAFTDLGSVVWARDAINTLAEKGIVNGKTETLFAPNDNVTRAEFAKMLMGTFGLNSAIYTTSSFNDVSTSDWYFTSVETAYNLGIITGDGYGSFNPNALITRQEMAVMVQRAAAVCGKTPAAVQEAIVFADDADIADYAKAAVSELNAAGIINGVTTTTFAPLANATRAQAAKILYSFL